MSSDKHMSIYHCSIEFVRFHCIASSYRYKGVFWETTCLLNKETSILMIIVAVEKAWYIMAPPRSHTYLMYTDQFIIAIPRGIITL